MLVYYTFHYTHMQVRFAVDDAQEPSSCLMTVQESTAEAQAAAAAEDAEAWQDISNGQWPFQALCEQLCLDLLHPVWKARHGAGVALREVLRSQAACAGVCAPLAPDQPSGCATLLQRTRLRLPSSFCTPLLLCQSTGS